MNVEIYKISNACCVHEVLKINHQILRWFLSDSRNFKPLKAREDVIEPGLIKGGDQRAKCRIQFSSLIERVRFESVIKRSCLATALRSIFRKGFEFFLRLLSFNWIRSRGSRLDTNDDQQLRRKHVRKHLFFNSHSHIHLFLNFVWKFWAYYRVCIWN